MKKTVFSLLMVLVGLVSSVNAQETVQSDTVLCKECQSDNQLQPTVDHYRIVTNRFKANWFVLANVGGHVFRGDYASVGDIAGTVSPDINVGFGKWFTPEIGTKIQFGISNSKGYSREKTYFTYGDQLTNDEGVSYWKSKMKWWDLNVNAMLNLSRLFKGYEGKISDKLMNQFIASVGIGILHHYGVKEQRNEWSGHFEFQYSRFFNKKKSFSLDLKARAMIYQTNFDGITTKKIDDGGHWFDLNVGLTAGFTYYFKKRHWDRCIPGHPIYNVNRTVIMPAIPCPEYGTLVFYVFFPNDYSGRDDAPTMVDEPVNAIDYLASGIFTQRRFNKIKDVEESLNSSRSLSHLKTSDVPTQKASDSSFLPGIQRGYEMSDRPISLSMHPDSMQVFKNQMGYYYAPVYSEHNTWYYRVDRVAASQHLMNEENYRESKSYALNAHQGLPIVQKHLMSDSDEQLYSFADVYGALETQEGNVALAVDEKTVKELNHIFNDGEILNVVTEGVATSQDNYSGEDAEEIGLKRNRELAFHRAYTVVNWLRTNPKFKGVPYNTFVVNALNNPIAEVQDRSTRELNAKLRRCVKVRIQYVVGK